jgi:hypothetical protein
LPPLSVSALFCPFASGSQVKTQLSDFHKLTRKAATSRMMSEQFCQAPDLSIGMRFKWTFQ